MNLLSQVMSEVRAYYLKRFFEAVREAADEGDFETEVALCDETGKIVSEGALSAGTRIDIVIFEGDTPTRSINVDTENALAFPGLASQATNTRLLFGSMKWNQMRFSCYGSCSRVRLIQVLTRWYRDWFEGSAEDPESSNCVHFISDPTFGVEAVEFVVDFGTAEVTSALELIELLSTDVGFAEIWIGHQAEIRSETSN